MYANRRRVRGRHGKRLLKKRGELIERSFAHCYETGAMRRTHLRGRENILKRLLIHVGTFNLSLIFRRMLGAGTPRELGNRLGLFFGFLRCKSAGKDPRLPSGNAFRRKSRQIQRPQDHKVLIMGGRRCSRNQGVLPRTVRPRSSTTESQTEHSRVELFRGITPLRARPTREALRGIY